MEPFSVRYQVNQQHRAALREVCAQRRRVVVHYATRVVSAGSFRWVEAIGTEEPQRAWVLSPDDARALTQRRRTIGLVFAGVALMVAVVVFVLAFRTK